MRTRSRPTALTTSLVGLVVAGSVLAGCSDTAADGSDPAPEAPPAGDVPFALVLPYDLAVSEDGSQVLANCFHGLCRWDTTDGSLAQVDDCGYVAISQDWSLFAEVGDDASVVVEDAKTCEVVQEFNGLEDVEVIDGSPVQDVAFSADGEQVAGAGRGGEVIVWSVDDGTETVTIEGDYDAATVAFSPDGQRLATSGDGPIEIYDLPSGDPVATLSDASPDSSALAWSPDGRWLAGPGPGAAPAIWDTESFTLADQLDEANVNQMAFAPDSRTIAVTSDTTAVTAVQLWTPKPLAGRGGPVRELVGHTERVGAVVFAPDGNTLYSVSGMEGVFAWDVETAKLVTRFELPER